VASLFLFLPSTPRYFHEKFGPSFNRQSVVCQHVRLPVVIRNRNFAKFVLICSYIFLRTLLRCQHWKTLPHFSVHLRTKSEN